MKKIQKTAFFLRSRLTGPGRSEKRRKEEEFNHNGHEGHKGEEGEKAGIWGQR
jgi:hypothetical protein